MYHSDGSAGPLGFCVCISYGLAGPLPRSRLVQASLSGTSSPYLQGCGKSMLAVWEAGFLRVTREAGFLRVTREAGCCQTGITKSQRTETDGYH